MKEDEEDGGLLLSCEQLDEEEEDKSGLNSSEEKDSRLVGGEVVAVRVRARVCGNEVKEGRGEGVVGACSGTGTVRQERRGGAGSTAAEEREARSVVNEVVAVRVRAFVAQGW